MKKVSLIFLTVALGIFLTISSASALTINYGEPILMIDGNADTSDSVTVTMSDNSSYQLIYDVLGDANPWAVASFMETFTGGDVVDIALWSDSNLNGLIEAGEFYSLGGDLGNSNYSAIMEFTGTPIPYSYASQPTPDELLNWWGINQYFPILITSWTIGSDPALYSVNFAISGGNDGIAPDPVPEPSTLLLLGSGLIGVGVYRWRRMKKQ